MTLEGAGDAVSASLLEGPRSTVAEMWNEAARAATGNLLMQANDDIVFRTPGWDKKVEETFAECRDKILLVHGDDLSGNGRPCALTG